MALPLLLGALLPTVGKLLDKVLPDTAAKDKFKAELALELQKQETELVKALLQSDLAQAEINKMDAQSGDKFRSYWRPALSWVCVLAFIWLTVLQPIAVFIYAAKGWPLELPEFDSSILSTVLFGVLGLAGYRSFEKVKGKK